MGKARQAELDSSRASLSRDVGLGQFLPRRGKADTESFGFAEPAFAFRFGDASGQIVADVEQALSLVGIDSKEWAANVPLTETV